MLSKNDKDLLIGCLIGSAVGAVGMLLLTPKPGVKLRHDLKTLLQEIAPTHLGLGKAMHSPVKKAKKQAVHKNHSVKPIKRVSRTKR